MTEDSGLFEAPISNPLSADKRSFEQRLDGFAEVAKEATQIAGKLRLGLNKLAENARLGSIASARAQVSKLSDSMAELSSHVDRLAEQSLGFGGRGWPVSDYMRELEPELVKRGIKVTKGPEPYWLAYPSWFKIEHDAKGSLGVTLNGERLDSIRPTTVAAKIAEAVGEKFQAKQFTELLTRVRDLLRRAGASGATVSLEDVYEVLAIEPGRRMTRSKEFSKEAFYYSVHRLAEEIEGAARPALSFPPANRPDVIFFRRDGESRKYLTVEFRSPS